MPFSSHDIRGFAASAALLLTLRLTGGR